MSVSNFFRSNDAERLWAYLDEYQKEQAKNVRFLASLPENKEVKAIGVLIVEALKHRGKQAEIQCLFFDTSDPKSPADGVFRSVNPICLTEDLKEYPLYQTLTQDLSDLIEWMVD